MYIQFFVNDTRELHATHTRVLRHIFTNQKKIASHSTFSSVYRHSSKPFLASNFRPPLSFNIFVHPTYFFMVYFAEATNSLRLSKLVVPSVKFRGDNALLECLYELNNQKNQSRNYVYENGRYYRRNNNNYFYDNDDDQEEIIYSVKWYKDGEEFYRFVPKAEKRQNKYDFDGIKVDVSIENS